MCGVEFELVASARQACGYGFLPDAGVSCRAANANFSVELGDQLAVHYQLWNSEILAQRRRKVAAKRVAGFRSQINRLFRL
jgi:hypothetical protein